ncbi:uncharacterized protein [Eucyclogobius newberryi]|uniref:uncharacterized protein n=1 Tax=Eucyclogobius newberryi TaxID=166745 RepID=UPI003B5B1F69
MGFPQVLPTSGEQLGKQLSLHHYVLKPTITAPDFVTVGVPSSAACASDCPSCTYSMSLEGQAAQGQGNTLLFTPNDTDLTVVCSVTKGTQVATISKKLQVLVGPVNVSISGSGLLNPSVSHTFSCHAHCVPSCEYSWRRGSGPWMRGQGNVIAVTPTEMDRTDMLVCKATNKVSGLFVAATKELAVNVGPLGMKIAGPDVIEMGEKAVFECSAVCRPSCRFVSSVDTQSIRGNVVELIVDRPLKSVTVKCEAQNTASRKSATTSKTVHLKGRGQFNLQYIITPSN